MISSIAFIPGKTVDSRQNLLLWEVYRNQPHISPTFSCHWNGMMTRIARSPSHSCIALIDSHFKRNFTTLGGEERSPRVQRVFLIAKSGIDKGWWKTRTRKAKSFCSSSGFPRMKNKSLEGLEGKVRNLRKSLPSSSSNAHLPSAET